MTDGVSVAAPAATPTTAPKKKATTTKVKTAKPKAGKKTSSHPSSGAMVIEAITKLGERGGSSLQAIKKYIAEVHKVDVQKQGLHIRNALKKAVETGKLTQPKGKGASGSFKLVVKDKGEKVKAEAESPKVVKKEAAPPKPKKTAKAPTTKKPAAVKAKTGEKKPAKKAVKRSSPKAKPVKSAKGKTAVKATT